MRNISLSSRLQWAFRGSVLPGALATGDVDNDGCKEFVVGSVQGELAVFRGRGGCGTWQHSEDQIEPEFDCWDAVVSGQIPPELLTHFGSESASMRRQSTYNSLVHGPTSSSNRGSLSVEDILYLFEGGMHVPNVGSGDTSDDEVAGYDGARRPSSLFDSEFAEHIKWEDALDIERDGRKPWILAQRLGTISSVVVADIANCGHNSIVVVNGEGKCYVFDYPFKRRLHPEMRKRRRQRNHYRRFSLERFFKDGVVVDSQDPQTNAQVTEGDVQQPVSATANATEGTAAPVSQEVRQQDTANGTIGTIGTALDSPSLVAIGGSLSQPQTVRANTTLPGFLAASTDQGIGGGNRKSANSKSTPAMRDYENDMEQFESPDLQALGEMALASTGVVENSDLHRNPNWRPMSYAETQRLEAQQETSYPMGLFGGIISSNASSHPDLPLAILSKCDANDGTPNAFAGSSDAAPCVTYIPASPAVAKSMSGFANGGVSVATSNNSSNNNIRQRYASDVGVDALSMAYGDVDTESDQDFEDVLSDSDECPLLTPEEAADIEKMWGANVGKHSGDWFPFVLESPDMTFDIPTNVEHAIVADVDSDGMNELVLTATDGFVYIFRVESPVKHEIKPTLASLGVLSNIPTTMPSANVTGNGSPYLHMSAPRSPDASDIDLYEGGKEPDAVANYTAGKQQQQKQQKGTDGQDREYEPKQVGNSDVGADSASDLSLVHQLLKSIKDVSATPCEKSPSEKSHVAVSDLASNPAQPSAAKDADTPTQHRSSTGRRTSISSRMREGFNGIVSGWDVSRRTSGSGNHSANPSTEHSRVQTRNHSANSTNTHSRKASAGEECADIQHSNAETSAAEEANEARQREQKRLSSMHSTQSGTSAGDVNVQRARNNSVSIGPVGALQAIPERQSGDTERVGSISDIDSLAEREPDRRTDSADTPKLSGHLVPRAGNSSSRAHSRNSSINRSNAPSTHAHSRHGSITSASSRPRLPSTTLHDPDSAYALELRYGNSCRTSRRGSIASNISAHEGNAPGNPTQPAVPLEAVVSARGSFSKPSYVHPSVNVEPVDDNNSVISQVTERLTELRFEKQPANETGDANTMPRYKKGKTNNSYFDGVDRDVLVRLPPSRGIVDWSATSVDKVATWFLDNIPGNVSMITAPAETFGAPVARQGQALFSDDSSTSSCSTCDCSACDSGSEDESGEFNDGSDKLAATETTTLKGRVEPIAYKVDANAKELPRLNLPKPLGLGSLNKGKQAEPIKPFDHLDSAGNTDNLAAESPKTESEAVAKKSLQQFLILSKPGGRFVPIDMLNYAILSTVEPPPMPTSTFTGCNTAHMMNVDISNATRNAQLAASLGMSLQSLSTADVLGTSGSTGMYQLPSWQSESMPWIQNIRPGSYGSTGHIDKSPAGAPGAEASYSQNSRNSSNDMPGASSNRITEEPMISQFPSSVGDKSLSKSSGSADVHASPQPFSAVPTSSSRKSVVSIGPPSMFNAAASITGGASISSNMRSIRSLHRLSSDGLRSQNFNAGHGPSPIYRGMPLSGTMTPAGTGYPLGYGQYDRRQLGFAGLRGYIGNNITRQHTIGNPLLSARVDDSSLFSGYFTPFASAGQHPARPFSSGSGQAIGYGAMPREPIGQVLSSSVSSNASATNVNERVAAALRYDGARQNQLMYRAASATPARNSASPQKGQHLSRYSPSMTGWSSYKEGNVLGSIKDQGPLSRIDNVSRNSRNGPAEVDNLAIVETAPDVPSLGHDGSNVLPGVITTTSPSSEISAPAALAAVYGHDFWGSAEPASARSHSSLGTGTSGNYLVTSDVKGEEEIEEAPQPVAMDVTTFMVGGVTAGKRLRRILHGPAGLGHNTEGSAKSTVSAGYKDALEGKAGDKSERDIESTDEYVADELVSLVSMDSFITCYDPIRKISNTVNLNSKDPALGIWKIKMHEEISHPSPLETMLQDGCIDLEKDGFTNTILSSTPAKRIYRRVGLSRRDLFHAVQYASYIEERVILLNKLERQRRKRARRIVRKARSQTRVGYGSIGDKKNSGGSKRDGSSPGLPKGNALWRAGKVGFNGRFRDGLTRYHRVGQTVRNLGSQLRELATSGSTQQSSAILDLASTALPVLTPHGTVNPGNPSVIQSEYTTPNLSLSPISRKHFANMHPQIHCSTYKPDSGGTSKPTSGDNVDTNKGRLPATAIDFTQPEISSSTGQHLSSHIPSSSGGNAAGSSLPNNLMDTANARRAYNSDLATTLVGWYGDNKDDFRRNLRVADHLVVSTWRGTTYFVDAGTILDIAHYNELFTNRWTNSQAAASGTVSAQTTKSYADILANTPDKDICEATDYSGHMGSSVYGSLSEFADISGLVSRLRANASVVQFKFQETVSAFLADTYAPATGGPNVPCLFYVDYKDRIWVYYHLDEIAEVDDVYGATWYRNELESQYALLSRAKGSSASNSDLLNYDKPFSVVDLAYRRVSLDPWFPLPSDSWFTDVVSFHDLSYPYSFRSWRTQAGDHGGVGGGGSSNNNKLPKKSSTGGVQKAETLNASIGTFYTHSDSSTNAIGMRANANATGSFHPSYVPGPFMCPIWADINAVDLYDVSVCNLLELVAPELLAMKDIFCKDIGINPDTMDEKVNLASIPGLANWVRSCLYHS